MPVTTLPKAVRFDTLETFDEVDGLQLSLVKVDGEEDGFLPGPPCAHLILSGPGGVRERVFSVTSGHEDLARAIGYGMTLAISIARAEWESPAPRPECTVIPFPGRRD